MNVLPTKILLATDGSEDAALALRAAADIHVRTGAELHLVYARRRLTALSYSMVEVAEGAHGHEREEAERLLEEQAERVRDAGATLAEAHMRQGPPAEEIVRLAEEIDVDLIAVGSRGLGGIRRALMGSVSDDVVRYAHCPVLVVREKEEQHTGVFPTKILLTTDGSEDAELALGMAVGLANSTNSELHLISIGGRSYPRYRVRHPELLEETLRELKREAQKTLEAQMRKVEEAGGSVTGQHIAVGNPAEKILNQADEVGAGLIVMGSRGLGGIRRALMGSVSDSVVRHAPCPVLIVRKEKHYRGQYQSESTPSVSQ